VPSSACVGGGFRVVGGLGFRVVGGLGFRVVGGLWFRVVGGLWFMVVVLGSGVCRSGVCLGWSQASVGVRRLLRMGSDVGLGMWDWDEDLGLGDGVRCC
jgi:hypothetical protein